MCIRDSDEAAYRRNKPVDKLPLQDKIVLDDIVYKYPNSEVLIFDHAHMEIPAGKSVGIVGTSGAGKTTIVDIMPVSYTHLDVYKRQAEYHCAGL